MILNVILNAAVIVQIFVITIDAYKYEVLYRSDPFISPCEMPDVHFVNEIADMSNFNFEYLSDETYYFHGSIVFIKDIGTQDNPFAVELFKKSRGTWVNTIYSMSRKDWCRAAFNPSEIWYKYMSEVSPKDRECPFSKGTKLDFNDSTTMILNSADPQMSGEYKMQIIVELKEINITICANMFAEIYRN